MAIENPHHYSTTSGVTTTTQISDDIDYPHSGLIKALSQGIRGNYAIKGSAADFDITLTSSTYTQIAVTTGKAYRDGKLVTITALSATNLTGVHATEDVYQLLVAQANNTMALRGSNSVTNRIPDLTDGDIPIAVIKLVAGSAQGSNATTDRLVQFLTTSKVSNDLSIGYDNSGYTEAGNLSGDANGITMTGLYKLDTLPTATVASDDKVIIQDNSDSDKIKTVTASSIAGLATGISNVVEDTTPQLGGNLDVNGNSIVSDSGNENIVIAPHGSGQVVIGNQTETVNRLSSNGARDLKLEANSGVGASITLKDGTNADINISPNGTGKVGIGETSPDAPLHITYSGTDECLILESTDSNNTAAPDLVLLRNSSSPADNDIIGNIQFRGKDSAGNEEGYATILAHIVDKDSTSEDAGIKFYIKKGGSSPDHNFQFVGNTIAILEQSSVDTADGNNRGRIWVKSGAPNELYFTNDSDNDIQLTNGGTGPLLTGKHSIWIPAEAISPRSDAGCADLATTAAATAGRPDIRALAFDKDSDEHAQFTIAMPKMWNEGTITAQFYWTNATATSGGVSWGLQGVSLSNSDGINTAFGTPVVTDDTQVGTAKDVHISAESSAITIGGSPAANDLTCFQVYRDVSDSNDTLNEDALLLGIKLFYTIDAPNDE